MIKHARANIQDMVGRTKFDVPNCFKMRRKIEKEEKMMDKEAETGMMGKKEVENWIGDINKEIGGETDEWTKERLLMERWVLNQVLTGKKGI